MICNILSGWPYYGLFEFGKRLALPIKPLNDPSMSVSSGKAGVLYIVTGEKFTQAAILSAELVRKSNPKLQIAIFTDQDIKRGDIFRIYLRSQQMTLVGNMSSFIARHSKEHYT